MAISWRKHLVSGPVGGPDKATYPARDPLCDGLLPDIRRSVAIPKRHSIANNLAIIAPSGRCSLSMEGTPCRRTWTRSPAPGRVCPHSSRIAAILQIFRSTHRRAKLLWRSGGPRVAGVRTSERIPCGTISTSRVNRISASRRLAVHNIANKPGTSA